MTRLSLPGFFLFLLTSAAVLPAFQAGAYLPHYRLDPLPGAANSLGRPGWDTASDAWDGRIAASGRPAGLPAVWHGKSWSSRLVRSYGSFCLHIPLDDAFLSGDSPSPGQLSYLRSLKSLGGGEISLSLIGHSSDFLPLTKEPAELAGMAGRLAELCADNGLDGIDIDWEFLSSPRPAENEGLTALIRALRSALPRDCIVSAAVSRWRLPDTAILASLDRIHLMAYDGYGRHATYESAVADAEVLITRLGISLDRLYLGIPFYGRVYDGDSPDYWKETMNYREIVEDFRPPPESDEAGTFFFNGAETVEAKTRWAAERGLGGVFVWEPFYDTADTTSLSERIRSVVDEY